MSYSGYGDWNSGSSRGYEGYGYGYGYGQEAAGSYGYGLAPSGSWDLSGSDVEMAAEGDPGLAKLGQRLELGSHLEPEPMQGSHYGDRYDSFEPYDSRPSLPDRDLYRYDYGEAEPDPDPPYEPPYDPPYDPPYEGAPPYYANRRDPFPQRPREAFGGPRAQPWPREGRNGRAPAPPYPGGGRAAGPPWGEAAAGGAAARGQQGGGGGGSAPPRLPSLFSHSILPEPAACRGFPGGARGGPAAPRQRGRRGWRAWDPDFRPQRKKLKKDPGGKKRKQPGGCEDREENSDNSESENEEGTEGESGEKEEKEGSRGEGEEEEGRDSERGALCIQEEVRGKLQGGKKGQDRQKKRHRDRMVERIQFVCSLCKYRTFYGEEMSSHLGSSFHREHFRFVGTRLPQQTAEFLQEYVANKTRKTEERRRGIEDINAVIQQIYRDQDLTQDVGMEHFLRKVEAAHCAACDLFIPMQFGIIQKHLKSLDHNHNRRAMMEQSKKSSLVVARSILNNKLISKKLERYLKGENPFTDDAEEKEEPEEGEGGAGGSAEEAAAGDGSKEEEEEANVAGEKLEEEEHRGESLGEEKLQEEEEKKKEEEEEQPEETSGAEGAKEEPQGAGTEPEGPAEGAAAAGREPAGGPQPGQEQQQAAEEEEEEEEASQEAAAAQEEEAAE